MSQNKQKVVGQRVNHSWLYLSTLVLTLASPFVLGRVAHAATVTTNASDSVETTNQTNRSLTEKAVVVASHTTPATKAESSVASTSTAKTASEPETKSAASSKIENETTSAAGQPESQQSKAAPATVTDTTGQSQSAPAVEAPTIQPAVSTDESQVAEKASTAPAATSVKPNAAANKLTSRAAVQPATTADVPDDQVVNFTDSNLAAKVRASLKVAADADITVGAIRNYSGSTVAIGTETSPITVTSLTGMAAFQNLPTTKKLNLYVYLVNPQGQQDLSNSGFDLTPLENLSFSELGLYTAFFAKVDVTPLTKMTVDKLQYFNLQPDSNIRENYHAASNANYGLTNAQLKQLAPTIIAMSNNQVTSWKMVQLADNALTDFSVLNGMNLTTDMRIFAVGQAAINYQPINIVAGQPLTYAADEQLGINGEILHATYDQSNVITPVYTYDDDGNITSVTWDSAKYLGNNQFYIAAPEKNAATFYHGQWGYLGHTADTNYYISKYYGTVGYSLQLMTDAMIFRPTNWQTAPSITVNYLDQQTNEVIQTKTILGANKTVGDVEDLTPLTSDKGYDYVGASVNELQLTYSADPQTVALYFTPVESQGTVQINYVDETTGENLTTQTLTGKQGSHSDYTTGTTIQGYLNQGYLLVSDDYPSDGAIFADTPGVYTVSLKHGTTAVENQKKVTQTIHYVYADGTQAAPDRQTVITFNRSGSQDQVTNDMTWHNWTASTTRFEAQVSPIIANYVAKPAIVAAVDGLTPTSADLETTVSYTKNNDPSTSTDDTIDPGPTTVLPEADKVTKTPVSSIETAAQPAKLNGTKRQAQSDTATAQSQQQRLPQTDETSTTWLALAGVGLMTLLSAIGIERKH